MAGFTDYLEDKEPGTSIDLLLDENSIPAVNNALAVRYYAKKVQIYQTKKILLSSLYKDLVINIKDIAFNFFSKRAIFEYPLWDSKPNSLVQRVSNLLLFEYTEEKILISLWILLFIDHYQRLLEDLELVKNLRTIFLKKVRFLIEYFIFMILPGYMIMTSSIFAVLKEINWLLFLGKT